MKEKDVAFLKQWRLQRAGGFWRYALISGVLAWGVPMFVVMTFVVSGSSTHSAENLAVAAAIYLTGGLLYGSLVWGISERRHRKLVAESEATDRSKVV